MLYDRPEEFTPELIKYYIDESEKRNEEMAGLYDRYKADKCGVPIKERVYKINNIIQSDKINNKINNDFFSEIIDIKVGFFTGVPVTVILNREKYSETIEEEDEIGDKIEKSTLSDTYYEQNEYITRFGKIANIDDLNIETAKKAAICGYCGRLLYVEEGTGDIKAILRDPWNCIFFGNSIDSPSAAIYHFEEEHPDSQGNKVETYYAYLYDENSIKVYKRKESDDKYVFVKEIAHPFAYNPMFGIANNNELQGDVEKALELIDAYDRTVSDLSNENEQFRLAYMVSKGCRLNKDTLEDAQRSGGFSIPTPEGSIEFLTKNIDIKSVLDFLSVLENNIYRFTASPNMKDQSFGNNASGVAMDFKFRAFEYKCKIAEVKMTKALRYQYKILSDIWNKQNAQIDYLDIDFIFTRNYPKNLLEEAEIQYKLKGLVSEYTRLSLASFVQDPAKESQAMKHDTVSSVASSLMAQYRTINNESQNIDNTNDNTGKGVNTDAAVQE